MDAIQRLAIFGAVTLLAACSRPDTHPSGDPLMTEITSIVGPSAKPCGRVSLGMDPAVAWRCAEQADSQGIPYWFAMQREGIDSKLWSAALLTPSGERFILLYDSNYMGGPGLLPSLTRRTCDGQIGLAPGYPEGLMCRRRRR